MIADGVILKTAAIASQIYFRFLVVDNTTEQLDLENIGIPVGILFVGVLELQIILGVIYSPSYEHLYVKQNSNTRVNIVGK